MSLVLIKGWMESPLSELATVQAGIGFPKKYQGESSGKYPVYKVGDVSRAYLNNKALLNIAEHYVSEEVAKELKGKIFPESSILFAKIGEALKLNRRVKVSREGLADNNVMAVVPKDNVDNNYLFRFLQYYDVASLSRSTTVPSIRKGDVENITVPHPELEEQKLIADKLDSVLAKVEAAQARLEKIPTILKRFRQSVLAAATSGELTKDWREENGILLAHWRNSNIGELAEVKTGNTPLKSNKSFYLDGTIPWLTSTVTGQSLVTEASKFITKKAVEDCRLKVFPSGTLLVAMYGEGKTRGQVTELGIAATINQACAAVLVKESKVNKGFIKLSITSNYEKTRLMAEGGAQPNLNLSKVRAIPVSLPSYEEQSEIIRIVKELFSNADLVEEQYKAAKLRVDKMTQSILARAFSGKLFSPISEDDRKTAIVKTQSSEPQHNQPKAIDKEPEQQAEVVSTTVNESSNEQVSEVFQLLKNNSKGMSAQALFDAQSENTFNAIDDLFSELKKLIEQKVVIQAGEGENCTFKATKK